MLYLCTNRNSKRTDGWNGELVLISKEGNTYELNITGRGSHFHIIVGKHQYGNYLCIPNHDIGCELSDFGDLFWNTEQLTRHLQKADAITVACGLSHLSELG